MEDQEGSDAYCPGATSTVGRYDWLVILYLEALWQSYISMLRLENDKIVHRPCRLCPIAARDRKMNEVDDVLIVMDLTPSTMSSGLRVFGFRAFDPESLFLFVSVQPYIVLSILGSSWCEPQRHYYYDVWFDGLVQKTITTTRSLASAAKSERALTRRVNCKWVLLDLYD